MNDQQISNRQGSWLLLAAVIGTVFLPLPGIVSQAAGSAGWISVIVGYSMSLVPVYLIYKTGAVYVGKTLPEYTELMLGKIIGKMVNLYLLTLYFYLTAMLVRQLGELYTVAIMPRTPIIIFSASILILVVFMLRQGLEVLARVNELLILIIVISLLFMVTLTLPDISFDNFLPLMGEGIGAIMTGGLFVFVIAVEYVFLLGIILPHFREQKKSLSLILVAIFVGMMVLNSVVIANVGIFEVNEINRFLYPVIQMAKVVEIGDFITGIEVLLLGAWSAASLMTISLYLYATLVLGAQVFAIDDYRELVLVSAFLILAVAMIPDNVLSMARELHILTNIFFLPIGLALPVLLFTVSRFKA